MSNYRIMREVLGYTDDLPPLPPQRTPLSDADRRTNDMIVNDLRLTREHSFRERLRCIFAARPLRLDPQLPLPSPKIDPTWEPWLLNIEHLQDICSKTVAIYRTYTQYTSDKLYKFIFDQWILSHGGNVHKVDLEFARFFAKMIDIGYQKGRATAQDLIPRSSSFLAANDNFLAGHQIEFYNIKPLYRALFMMIETQIPENETNLEFFEGLDVLEKINENEVVTTLPKAYQFIMGLDQKEGTGAEKRDEKILDHWLGIPEVQLQMWYNANNKSRNRTTHWTGGLEEIPEDLLRRGGHMVCRLSLTSRLLRGLNGGWREGK
ncbi:uncharacterized protein LY89DRAFT_677444 [Mollisia scopiformis]|uniref:Uncharacterized protein n=1 Tax=Mollisia scopiformis TaxID=149040 RepID=A0A132B712_MOLSC|nr:uncharacterized protein LY89DRAFT_677444 [Mollisia scopiformis]KUJ08131.1 hypothetical protein LY89DRAFT_677444 [Mollisia scopiformis]